MSDLLNLLQLARQRLQQLLVLLQTIFLVCSLNCLVWIGRFLFFKFYVDQTQIRTSFIRFSWNLTMLLLESIQFRLANIIDYTTFYHLISILFIYIGRYFRKIVLENMDSNKPKLVVRKRWNSILLKCHKIFVNFHYHAPKFQ